MSPSKPSSKDYVTPPSSFKPSYPISPPTSDEKASKRTSQKKASVEKVVKFNQALRIIHIFQDIKAGTDSLGPWTVFQLAPGEYQAIRRLLKRYTSLFGFVEDKIRLDYVAETHQLAIRMNTPLHDTFIAYFQTRIMTWLDGLSDDPVTRKSQFAEKIISTSTSRKFFPVDDGPSDEESRHSPDATFHYEESEYPGIITEIGYSQSEKKVRDLAEDYLMTSDGNVRVVIGINLEYGMDKKTRAATFSVWRLHDTGTPNAPVLEVYSEVDNAPFRDELGNPTAHEGIKLRLRDFASKPDVDASLDDADKDLQLIISTQQLCNYLWRGERALEMERKRGTLNKEPLKPNTRKRKRERTPPDEISKEDEDRWLEEEEERERKHNRKEVDSDFEPKE